MKLLLLCAALFSTVCLHASAFAPRVVVYNGYALDPNGNLRKVNTGLGLSISLGSLGVVGTECMAQDLFGRLWTARLGGASQATVFEIIDPVALSVTHQFSVQLGGAVKGMAFDGFERVWVTVDMPVGNDKLVAINQHTGAITQDITCSEAGFTALAFVPTFGFYAWHATGPSSGKGLMSLSSINGGATDVNASIGGGTFLQAFAVDEQGDLIGAGEQFYDVNIATGAAVATTNFSGSNLRGMAITHGLDQRNCAFIIETDGDFSRINLENGARKFIGNCGHSPIVALSRATSIGLVACVDLGASTRFVEIDPRTASATLLGTIPFGNVVGGAAISGAGSTSLACLLDSGGVANDQIVVAGVSSGGTASAASLHTSDLVAMDIGPYGHVFAWDSARGLVLTGASAGQSFVDFDPNSGAHVALSSIALGHDWQLYGVGSGLYKLDVDGTHVTLIGSATLANIAGFETLVEPFDDLVTAYCTAQTNSANCTVTLGRAGHYVPSASASSGFLLTATNLLPSKAGLFFYGVNGRQAAPFLGGTLCLVTPIRRTTLLNSGGNVGCSGSFAFDFNVHIASGGDPALVSGQLVDVQCWSRDPASLSLTNLSGALEFTIFP